MNDRIVLVVLVGEVPKAQDTQPSGNQHKFNSAAYRDNHERIFGKKGVSAEMN